MGLYNAYATKSNENFNLPGYSTFSLSSSGDVSKLASTPWSSLSAKSVAMLHAMANLIWQANCKDSLMLLWPGSRKKLGGHDLRLQTAKQSCRGRRREKDSRECRVVLMATPCKGLDEPIRTANLNIYSVSRDCRGTLKRSRGLHVPIPLMVRVAAVAGVAHANVDCTPARSTTRYLLSRIVS